MAMIVSTFVRLSTGLKMLIILSTALLPLGLIALATSLESARGNRFNREAETRMMASESARQLTTAIFGVNRHLNAAIAGLDGAIAPDGCKRALEDVAKGEPYPVQFALADRDGRFLCATSGFSSLPLDRPAPGIGTAVGLIDGAEALRFVTARGDLLAAGEFSRVTLKRIVRPGVATAPFELLIRQGDARLALAAADRRSPLSQKMTVLEPVANGQLVIEMTVSATPLRAIEVLMVVLPLLMWIAAAVIGWLVVDRLLLRPLEQMQAAIMAYNVGAGPLAIPPMKTPAQEIRTLGDSFRDVTRKVTEHEAELEAGLARQTKLTREVHHRVKNNLQVVSSLISLHARGAKSDEASDAYASIQRRVDALAVVHRHHYAELEENRGVSLRALIGELASNLRSTAPPQASRLMITLELMPAFASQDVAVPVAFLITELVELVMACDPNGGIAIALRPGPAADRAELSLLAPGLKATACLDHPSLDRFNRIVGGLARQLRAPLTHDEAVGSYAILIAIVPVNADEA